MPSWHLDSANNVNAFLDCIGGTPVKASALQSDAEPVPNQELKEVQTDRAASRSGPERSDAKVKSDSTTVKDVH